MTHRTSFSEKHNLPTQYTFGEEKVLTFLALERPTNLDPYVKTEWHLRRMCELPYNVTRPAIKSLISRGLIYETVDGVTTYDFTPAGGVARNEFIKEVRKWREANPLKIYTEEEMREVRKNWK